MADLRTITREIHQAAEHNKFSQMLLNGEFTQDEWATFLNNQLAAYNAIEARGLITLADVLRVPKIILDLQAMGLPKTDIVPATKRYVNYISTLPDDLVWSHIYVRYMGDAHGGQMIKKASKWSTNLLDFDDRVACIQYLREKTANANPDEAIKAFSQVIEIYNDLYTEMKVST